MAKNRLGYEEKDEGHKDTHQNPLSIEDPSPFGNTYLKYTGRTDLKLGEYETGARGALYQGTYGSLSGLLASNVARFGLSGTGIGSALMGLGTSAVNTEAKRLAQEREVTRLMAKLGWSRAKAVRHLGIVDPGGLDSRIGPSIGRLEGASRMFSPVAASSGTGFGTAPGSGPLPSVASPQTPRMFSSPAPPGLMGPNPLRLT